VQPELFVYF